MSDETWEAFLIVMLQLTHKHLKEKKGSNDVFEQLAPLLLETTFDLWLKSGIQKNQTFDTFTKFACCWTHREDFLSYWLAVCNGLTQRIINILFDVPNNYILHMNKTTNKAQDTFSESFIAKFQNECVIVHCLDRKPKIYYMSADHTIYCWYRMLFLLEQNPNNQDFRGFPVEPEQYATSINLFNSLIKLFSGNGKIEQRKKKDIYLDQEEVERASKNFIEPKVQQHANFSSELNTLYKIIKEKKFRLKSIKEKREKCSSFPPKMPNGNTMFEMFGIKFFKETRDRVIINFKIV